MMRGVPVFAHEMEGYCLTAKSAKNDFMKYVDKDLISLE